MIVRGHANAYPTSELLPNSLNEADSVIGSNFEARPVYFVMGKKRYPIYFRNGLFDLLSVLSDDGNNVLQITTHACQHYATRIRDYLSRLHLRETQLHL